MIAAAALTPAQAHAARVEQDAAWLRVASAGGGRS